MTELPSELKHIVNVYTVADKYDVPVLKEDILKSFVPLEHDNWLALWNVGELSGIIEAIFFFTCQNDSLRKAAGALSLEHIAQLRESNAEAPRT